MKKLICMMLFFSLSAWAQETAPAGAAAADTAKPAPPWTHKLVGSLLGNQVSFTDWKQGGEDAIAWNLLLDGKSALEAGKNNWSTSYILGFGNTKLGSKSTRKTDDRFEVQSIYTRKYNLFVNPYVAATFKTQFAPGYSYDAKDVRTQVSRSFDPAYLTQTVGIGWQTLPQVKIRLGAGLRETLASNYAAIYTDDKKTKDKLEKSVVQGGAESAVNVDWKLSQNLLLTSLIESFTGFTDFSHPMLRTNTALAAKVSKYVTAMFNVLTINEPRVSPRAQVKQAVSLGLNYTFF
ncbi:MAG TPA: DUF3078 domain-containing protein [bacterium]|nr:DUF3078 domain-containing protein [bacterium]HQG46980.1 DUF3078 domain-containing protein [bacterium]HQI47924.1 DUF3078 domain-containing protein [bacterium]HQJ64409.1 DUF3078 domain-containing protein [bacterium]HQJ65521.1 DUF3078 domain-containing protein [bacterium]